MGIFVHFAFFVLQTHQFWLSTIGDEILQKILVPWDSPLWIVFITMHMSRNVTNKFRKLHVFFHLLFGKYKILHFWYHPVISYFSDLACVLCKLMVQIWVIHIDNVNYLTKRLGKHKMFFQLKSTKNWLETIWGPQETSRTSSPFLLLVQKPFDIESINHSLLQNPFEHSQYILLSFGTSRPKTR